MEIRQRILFLRLLVPITLMRKKEERQYPFVLRFLQSISYATGTLAS